MSGMQNHAIGHYGHAHGDNHFSTYETVQSLPVILADGGYRTCSIGKYHLAPEYVYHFEEYRNQGVQGNRNAVRMAQNAIDWIKEDDKRPFFLYWCSSDPHRGGGPDGFANHNENPDYYPGVTQVKYRPEEIIVPAWMNDTPTSRKELAEYYQAISRLVQGVGRLIEGLKDTGHAEDTLVMFLSDTGPPWPGAKTNLYQSGMNLPLIVFNPLAEKKAKTNDAVVMWTDITPTILDFCQVTPKPGPPVRPGENTGERQTAGRGRAVPYEFHGRSFLAVLSEEHPPGWAENYASHTFHEITMYYPMRSVISGDYKYIFNIASPLPYPFASDLYACPTWQEVLSTNAENYGKRSVYQYLYRQRHELYNIKDDPDEINNLATDSQHAAKLTELQGKVQAFQKRTQDPWLSKWEYE
jgi:N-sulfoglucosamine sulfohydrolase